MDGRIGPAFLMRSQSNALPHLFKPELRIGARKVITPALELGASLVTLLDTNEHYRVTGVLGHGRWAFWQRPGFSAGLSAGLGVGYGADILSSDLTTDTPVLPYGFVGADARWQIGQRYLIGTEMSWANLSVLSLGLSLGTQF